ncbi:MAG: hypothetical protein Crog3KO_27740 [Crocinitomicaceae bacterium]
MSNNDIEIYKDEFRNSATKVLLSAVSIINPAIGIGSAIVMEGFEYRGKVEQRRINSLVEELNNRVDELESQIVPLRYFEGDDFYDLSLKVYETAIRTSSQEKHKIISRIFMNTIDENCQWESDLSNIFLDIVKEFSNNHFVVFKFLSENINREDIKSYEQLHHEFQKSIGNFEIDVYQFRYYCKEIENKTLLRFSRDINEINSSGGVLALESYEDIKGIALSSLGDKFIELYA